ncbi:Squalene epoxidase, partial [Serendipita sp. 400]
MNPSKYDVIIVGAGVAGPAMAYALSSSSNLRKAIPESSQRKKPLQILLVDSKLRKPERIVGELLQPGGVLALRRLGLERALDNIDAVRAKGYCVMRPKVPSSLGKSQNEGTFEKGSSGTQFEQVHIPYPDGNEGRSFHHGEFVSSLRACAASAPGVTLLEASVQSDLVYCPHTGRILGVRATRSSGKRVEIFLAKLTIFANGNSSFRKAVYLPATTRPPAAGAESISSPAKTLTDKNLDTKALGSFYGLVLPHPPNKSYILPMYQHGTVVLVPDAAGPILLYQVSSHDTRILIDIPKNSPHARAVPAYIKSIILPNLPTPELRESLQSLVDEAEEKEGKLKMQSAINPFFPAPPQGGCRTREGGLLLGDAWNQRHPLTGGGMTVAFWDIVTLASELISTEKELFGEGGTEPATSTNESKDTMPLDGHVLKHEEEWTIGRWDLMDDIFNRWWWRRKGYASTINILSVALYDLFGGS